MRMSVMGGRKPCVLKKKGAIVQSLVPPYGFGVWDHSLLVCQLHGKRCM